MVHYVKVKSYLHNVVIFSFVTAFVFASDNVVVVVILDIAILADTAGVMTYLFLFTKYNFSVQLFFNFWFVP